MTRHIPSHAAVFMATMTLLHGIALGDGHPVDKCNVVWETPGHDSSGSMPLGNGDIGLNVWVERDGDLRFYISKTDAWSENGRLLKLGRVGVKLSPNPFVKGAPFRQTLRLRQGEMEILAGKADRAVRLTIWVDAKQPVIRVEAACERAVAIKVALEPWRTAPRQLKDAEMHSAYSMASGPSPVIVTPDTLLDETKDRIVWFHRNATSCWPATMKLQGLDGLADARKDPLLNRTFGAAIRGDGLVKADAKTLRSAHPAKRFTVSIYPHTRQTETIGSWLGELDVHMSMIDAMDIDASRDSHRKWWADFWLRSWIRVSGSTSGAAMTTNDLPLRIGADSDGKNRFHGKIRRAQVFGRALTADQIVSLAADAAVRIGNDPALVGDWAFDRSKGGVFTNKVGTNPPAKIVRDVKLVEDATCKAAELNGRGWIEVPDAEVLDLTTSCTLAAWVCPGKLPVGGGRIIDKSRAGTANGYLLDTHPGHSLRLIVEGGTLTHDARLPVGKWSHVAGTYDAKMGMLRLYVNGKRVASQKVGSDLAMVSQRYALQRYVSACAGRGAFPVKFNGSIFTVDAREPKEKYDADYRRWGGCYWFQNTRLVYWPMLASGDFEMIQPLFKMFLDALPLAEARTKHYFDHEGAFFPETMTFWASYANSNYGWDRKSKHVSHVDNTYIRRYWSGQLELTAIMLDAYAFTQDKDFAEKTLLPFAEVVIRFFDRHYPRDERGRILFKPAQALETWHEAVNPMPEIAGLRFLLPRLLDLPNELTTDQQRKDWRRLLGELPDLPTRQHEGKSILAAAGQLIGPIRNSENPELYAVFPFRLFGVGKPDLDLARRTFAARRVKGNRGWQQDDTQAALLGLTEQAARYVTTRFANKHAGSRFPVFWGPNFDWIPDQDHGSNAIMALQTMLMQTEGTKILLLPAWPKTWDVAFKLHAPMRTVVEGEYRSGRLARLVVSPSSRSSDVVVLGRE